MQNQKLSKNRQIYNPSKGFEPLRGHIYSKKQVCIDKYIIL